MSTITMPLNVRISLITPRFFPRKCTWTVKVLLHWWNDRNHNVIKQKRATKVFSIQDIMVSLPYIILQVRLYPLFYRLWQSCTQIHRSADTQEWSNCSSLGLITWCSWRKGKQNRTFVAVMSTKPGAGIGEMLRGECHPLPLFRSPKFKDCL